MDYEYARDLAAWARNPCGSWKEAAPKQLPRSIDNVREWAVQACRDAGITGDAFDNAVGRIEAECLHIAECGRRGDKMKITWRQRELALELAHIIDEADDMNVSDVLAALEYIRYHLTEALLENSE